MKSTVLKYLSTNTFHVFLRTCICLPILLYTRLYVDFHGYLLVYDLSAVCMERGSAYPLFFSFGGFSGPPRGSGPSPPREELERTPNKKRGSLPISSRKGDESRRSRVKGYVELPPVQQADRATALFEIFYNFVYMQRSESSVSA